MGWRALAALILCLGVLGGPALAQGRHETGFLDRAVVVDGVEHRYQVYVPRDFDPRRKWPVILYLHGGGEYGSGGIAPTAGAIGQAIRLHPERFPAIVLFPQAHADGTPSWQQASGKAALAEVDAAVAEFHGDLSRIYLTGASAGGNGAWYLAYHHPERFAALLVVCGYVSDFTGKQSHLFYPGLVGMGPERYATVAQAVQHLPIWIFHGDADRNVSVEESRQMAAALKAFGADVRYTELAGVDHAAWTPAYNDPEVFAWLLSQRRR